MKALPVVVAITSIVTIIYLIAVAIYLRSLKTIVTSTTELNILFWVSITLIAIFAGIVVYSIYEMTRKDQSTTDVQPADNTKSVDNTKSADNGYGSQQTQKSVNNNVRSFTQVDQKRTAPGDSL